MRDSPKFADKDGVRSAILRFLPVARSPADASVMRLSALHLHKPLSAPTRHFPASDVELV